MKQIRPGSYVTTTNMSYTPDDIFVVQRIILGANGNMPNLDALHIKSGLSISLLNKHTKLLWLQKGDEILDCGAIYTVQNLEFDKAGRCRVFFYEGGFDYLDELGKEEGRHVLLSKL